MASASSRWPDLPRFTGAVATRHVWRTLARLDTSVWAPMRDAGRATYHPALNDFGAASECIQRMIVARNPWSGVVGTGLSPAFRRSDMGRDVLRALRIPEQYWADPGSKSDTTTRFED